MAQQTIVEEGAFNASQRKQINENFGELYGSSGTFTATGASAVTVANANVTANSIIVFTLKTVGGTVGAYPSVKTITPGTGFTVAATALDTSIYNYKIIH